MASHVIKVDQLPTAMTFSADGKILWVAVGLNSTLVQFDPLTRPVMSALGRKSPLPRRQQACSEPVNIPREAGQTDD